MNNTKELYESFPCSCPKRATTYVWDMNTIASSTCLAFSCFCVFMEILSIYIRKLLNTSLYECQIMTDRIFTKLGKQQKWAGGKIDVPVIQPNSL